MPCRHPSPRVKKIFCSDASRSQPRRFFILLARNFTNGDPLCGGVGGTMEAPRQVLAAMSGGSPARLADLARGDLAWLRAFLSGTQGFQVWGEVWC